VHRNELVESLRVLLRRAVATAGTVIRARRHFDHQKPPIRPSPQIKKHQKNSKEARAGACPHDYIVFLTQSGFIISSLLIRRLQYRNPVAKALRT
jgi:hypothetical protein